MHYVLRTNTVNPAYNDIQGTVESISLYPDIITCISKRKPISKSNVGTAATASLYRYKRFIVISGILL
jgi:hypothetical protein